MIAYQTHGGGSYSYQSNEKNFKSSLESLVKLGFSSGGARPKAMLKV